MRILILFMAVALAGPAAGAGAADWTGNYWLSQCRAPKGSFDGGTCSGFVIGVEHAFRYGELVTWLRTATITKKSDQSILKDIGQIYCMPDGVTVGQMQDIFVKYLINHPERRHEPGEGLFINALMDVYPCQ